MDKEAEGLLKDLYKKIRKLLRESNSLNQNYDIKITLGRYTISLIRYHDFNDQIQIVPNEIYDFLNQAIIDIQVLWEEKGNGQEFFEDYSTNDISLSIDIESREIIESIERDIKSRIQELEAQMADAVSQEKFEIAAKLRNKIKDLGNKIN